jgi:hypothetical protein
VPSPLLSVRDEGGKIGEAASCEGAFVFFLLFLTAAFFVAVLRAVT